MLATPKTEYVVTLSHANEHALVAGSTGIIHWTHLGDAIQSARNLLNCTPHTAYAVIELPANKTVASWDTVTNCGFLLD